MYELNKKCNKVLKYIFLIDTNSAFFISGTLGVFCHTTLQGCARNNCYVIINMHALLNNVHVCPIK